MQPDTDKPVQEPTLPPATLRAVADELARAEIAHRDAMREALIHLDAARLGIEEAERLLRARINVMEGE
jgi:hypothetical protein